MYSLLRISLYDFCKIKYLRLKNPKFKPLSWKDIGIRKFEFVAKSQFLVYILNFNKQRQYQRVWRSSWWKQKFSMKIEILTVSFTFLYFDFKCRNKIMKNIDLLPGIWNPVSSLQTANSWFRSKKYISRYTVRTRKLWKGSRHLETVKVYLISLQCK